MGTFLWRCKQLKGIGLEDFSQVRALTRLCRKRRPEKTVWGKKSYFIQKDLDYAVEFRAARNPPRFSARMQRASCKPSGAVP
jgi:hypothetical protein